MSIITLESLYKIHDIRGYNWFPIYFAFIYVHSIIVKTYEQRHFLERNGEHKSYPSMLGYKSTYYLIYLIVIIYFCNSTVWPKKFPTKIWNIWSMLLIQDGNSKHVADMWRKHIICCRPRSRRMPWTDQNTNYHSTCALLFLSYHVI